MTDYVFINTFIGEKGLHIHPSFQSALDALNTSQRITGVIKSSTGIDTTISPYSKKISSIGEHNYCNSDGTTQLEVVEVTFECSDHYLNLTLDSDYGMFNQYDFVTILPIDQLKFQDILTTSNDGNDDTVQALHYLLDNGSVDLQTHYLVGTGHGYTLLHLAVKKANLILIETLLDLGADVQSISRTGHTPYDLSLIHI